MQKKIKISDVAVLGLALFAMFFGAGNVIFPPFLGMQSSPYWLLSILGFLLTDVIISTFSIIVMAKNDDGISCITGRLGKIPSEILNIIIILLMGPLIAVPRTSAASFDILMVSIFNIPSKTVIQVIFSIAFYTATWILIVKPNRICDIVGKFLTPLLLITIIIFFIKSIINPIGPQGIDPISQSPIGDGFLAGYQSIDLFGALCFGPILIATAKNKGYTTKTSRMKLLFMTTILCLSLLCFSSIALCYVGSTFSCKYADVSSQAVLLSKIGQSLFSYGGILIAILTCLACLTTAIGATSGSAMYFQRFTTKPKFLKIHSYKILITIICFISFVLSNIGFEEIIKYATPVLLIIFPMVVVLVILSWFNTKIKSDLVFIFSAIGALTSNIIIVVSNMFDLGISSYFPFANMNLGWIIPTLICLIIGFIAGKNKDDRHKLKIWKEINNKK